MSISEMVSPESSDALNGLKASNQNGVSLPPEDSPTKSTLTKQASDLTSDSPKTDIQTSDITSDSIQNDNQNSSNNDNSSPVSGTESNPDKHSGKITPELVSGQDWPFDSEQMFKIAFKFFKDNDGKAFHCSYDQRNLMLAYNVQIKTGDYNPDKERPLGAFDFVGHDRRNAWISLKGMSKSDAEANFLNTLDSLCSTFRLYVMAIKCDQDEKAKKLEEEEREKRRIEEEAQEVERKAQEAERNAQEEKKRKYEEQKQIIKQLLNKQTFYQFSSYAKKQYPNDLELQNHLIKQLQDQHFQQYMLQMSEQSTDLNNIIAMNLSNNNNNNINTNNNNNTSSGQLSPSTNVEPSKQDVQLDLADGGGKQYIRPDASSSMQDNIDLNGDSHLDRSISVLNDNGDEVEEYIEDVMHEIETASMWTRKDMVQFKETIKLEGPDGVLTIGHGEMATIRVPTHENGNCIFWEFATDNYDIGFGLFFEWTSTTDAGISVHISESEDEDEDEPEHFGDNPNDPERGIDSKEEAGKSERINMLSDKSDAPMSVIIPIYRRESHNEVFAGSHRYPGRGVYLLKFDNSFSLWRSKTLYYRVYYTQE